LYALKINFQEKKNAFYAKSLPFSRIQRKNHYNPKNQTSIKGRFMENPPRRSKLDDDAKETGKKSVASKKKCRRQEKSRVPVVADALFAITSGVRLRTPVEKKPRR
jgi:hypothetical protein